MKVQSAPGRSNPCFMKSLHHEGMSRMNIADVQQIRPAFITACFCFDQTKCLNQITFTKITFILECSPFIRAVSSSVFLMTFKLRPLCAQPEELRSDTRGPSGPHIQHSAVKSAITPLLLYWLTDSDGHLPLALNPEDANMTTQPVGSENGDAEAILQIHQTNQRVQTTC